ncbi:MAG TPA: GNAT family N-acetyltransferase [Acidimicrobiales bacterium]|nr:GNAT family N-acetyltransferase [Acidimicrobiales bacterium]
MDANLVLTLLHTRVAEPEPGRYWVVAEEAEVVGVVFQSPVTFFATLTPLPPEAVVAVVDVIADAGVDLPGVIGDAATAASVAGQWTERRRSAAEPAMGQRIYEVELVDPPAGVPGQLRPAVPSDRDLLVDWLRRFQDDVGEAGPAAAEALVDRRLPAGHFWVWDDGGPASMAAVTDPVAGVARIGAVYTPDDRRRHGYAGACVAAVSAGVLAAGRRYILYTDLGNPTSNSVYRRIGYRAVAECLRYRFT